MKVRDNVYYAEKLADTFPNITVDSIAKIIAYGNKVIADKLKVSANIVNIRGKVENEGNILYVTFYKQMSMKQRNKIAKARRISDYFKAIKENKNGK